MNSIRGWLAYLKPEARERASTLGSLELADFQSRAASQIESIVDVWGGALLADAVGMGKTRVALAAAVAIRRRQARPRKPVAIIAPARVLEHWRAHLEKAGLSEGDCILTSHTSLSRGLKAIDASVVIVDEAHRFRNPRARRTRALGDIAAKTPVILVSATPVARGVEDLHTLFSIFLRDHDVRRILGVDLSTAFDRAECDEFDLSELVRHFCVRRDTGDFEALGARPTTRLEVVAYQPSAAEAWIWRELEGELNHLDGRLLAGDWPRGLLVEHMLRRWESGAEALLESVASLADFHERWLEAQASGRNLDRAEFRRLFGQAPDQGVFHFMYTAPEENSIELEPVRSDLLRLRDIAERVSTVVDEPGGMEHAIIDLARDGSKLLVFTSYLAAAEGLFARITQALGADARVGLVTGKGAWATGLGKVDFFEVLRRFSPGAMGCALEDHQQVQVLVATDCISEGLDLHDCGRVVLADLPYTPLAIEQRIGRLVRPSSVHREVEVFLPRPEDWNDSLGMRRRIRTRLDDAARAGTSFSTLAGSVLDEGNPTRDNPFEALTQLEILIDANQCQARSLKAGSRTGDALAIVELQVGEQRHRTLLAFVAGRVSWRIADGLELAYRAEREDLVEGELDGHVKDHFERAIEKRRIAIQAALDAPFFLPRKSAQFRAWKLIEELIEREDYETLRRRLLVPRTRGLENRLDELVQRENAEDVLDFVRELDADSPLATVCCEIVATLQL